MQVEDDSMPLHALALLSPYTDNYTCIRTDTKAYTLHSCMFVYTPALYISSTYVVVIRGHCMTAAILTLIMNRWYHTFAEH